MANKVRTRFAPSPTGFMHIGNLRTALYSYLFAKSNGGEFILRIEDTDRERFVEGAIELIYSTLKKAGIDYDEGPDRDKGYGPYVQSERKPIYMEYAKKLFLLYGNELKICEIAWRCGYQDPLYFSKVFKKTYGVTPREYKDE